MTTYIDIVKTRQDGHRDRTYGQLLNLGMENALEYLDEMLKTSVGCWRDVVGFIRFVENTQNIKILDDIAIAQLISMCVRMTNAQLRKDIANNVESLCAKWVPRETKCKTPLTQYYYDELVREMFPNFNNGKGLYRKLLVRMTPKSREYPDLKRLVKCALKATNDIQINEINQMFENKKRQFHKKNMNKYTPILSMAHSMGPGHNNCLHIGIGLALLLSINNKVMTFSCHAQWHIVCSNNFVKNVQYLMNVNKESTNGLNSNLNEVVKLANDAQSDTFLGVDVDQFMVISDMEHDQSDVTIEPFKKFSYWNVSWNGREADYCGDYKVCDKLVECK
jgi:hypothetical protein